MASLIEVQIDSVRISLTNQMRIVILKEVNGDRFLPVWIGPYEAEAITIALQEIEVARPQTHDLIRNILAHLNAKLQSVEIVNVKDDVFYASLMVEVDQSVISIDARPSDAIALAIRCHVPIYVARQVLDAAGTKQTESIPDDIDDEAITASDEAAGEEKSVAGDLSIFADFLEKLDQDDDASDDDPESDEPAQPTL